MIVTVHPTEGTRNAEFFTEAADTVLRCLLNAADLGEHTMREVLTWARDFDDDTPTTCCGTTRTPRRGGRPSWRARCSASDT